MGEDRRRHRWRHRRCRRWHSAQRGSCWPAAARTAAGGCTGCSSWECREEEDAAAAPRARKEDEEEDAAAPRARKEDEEDAAAPRARKDDGCECTDLARPLIAASSFFRDIAYSLDSRYAHMTGHTAGHCAVGSV